MLSAPLHDQEKSLGAMNREIPPSSRYDAHDAGLIAMTHSEDARFATTEGTIYVSKPFRSRTTKKLRAMITFEARKTHFDTTNEASGTNEFRVRHLHFGCLRLRLTYSWPGFLYALLDVTVSVHSTDLYQ
jgi:sterol O-acyltransferase